MFGCLCFAQTLTTKHIKFDSQARAGIFLGFQQHKKGYVVFDLKSHDKTWTLTPLPANCNTVG